MNHGQSAYVHLKCRCDVCRAANAARVGRRRKEREAEELPADVVHGRSTYINWGCRCDVCSAAHKLYCKERYWRIRLSKSEA